MKKLAVLTIVSLLSVVVSACGITAQAEIDLSKMKNICELATMECYFNNVTKYKEEDATGALFWKKDKLFWIEYNGIVKYGVDASLIEVKVNGDKVKITIPEAEMLSSKVDEASLSEDSFYFDKDSATIDAEDQVLAFTEAQKELKKVATEDTKLLQQAQDKAKSLLEDYVNNIGKAAGVEYEIEWETIEKRVEVKETEKE